MGAENQESWRPDLFVYEDATTYLSDWCAAAKRETRWFSYGWFSRRSGLSRAWLPNVLAGRRRLGIERVPTVGTALGLTPRELAYLGELVLLQTVRDPILRHRIERRLQVSRRVARSLREGDSASETSEQRLAVLRALRWEQGEAARALLEEALVDPSVEIRGAAAWTLGRQRDERNLPLLLATLADPDFTVRSSAGWGLVGLGQVASAPIIRLMTHTRDPAVYEMCHLVIARLLRQRVA